MAYDTDFYNTYLPYAQQASQRTGLDPRLILAQSAIESGWGKHAPGNNMFGIKSHGQPGGNTLGTTEYGPNGAYRTTDSFRAYDHPGDSFGGYADFLLSNPRYKDVMGAQGLEAQAQALGKSGYATDPNYGSSVLSLANSFPAPDGSGGVAAINRAAGGGPQQAASGTLAFSGDSDGSGKQDNRFGLGDLFGASDETKAKMHGIGARLVRAAAALSAGVNPSQAAQFNTLGKSLEEQNKTDYQYMMGPNGQLIKINKDTGAVNFATLPGGGKGSFGIVMGKDAEGNPTPIGKINHSTGEYSPYGQQSNAQAGPQFGGDPSLTGQERYDSLTSDEKKTIDAWRSGTGIQPSAFSMRQPKVAKLVDAANSIGIDMTKYGERQAFFKGMASKSPTTAGGAFVMAPTVLDHLDNLATDYHTLANSNGGGYSSGAAVSNWYKDARGGTKREGEQTSADRNADTAGKEITSFLTRGHGGVSERQEAHEKLYLPRAAPEVQASALEAYRKQVADRFYELLEGSKGSVGADNAELAKVEAAFKAKDEALQTKIANLKAGKFNSAAKSAAPAATDGTKPPLASFFQ
jgi:hypothetical protein